MLVIEFHKAKGRVYARLLLLLPCTENSGKPQANLFNHMFLICFL